MSKKHETDLSHEELARLLQQSIHELGDVFRTELRAHVEQNRREHAELRAENAREHAQTRAMLEEKPDYHEVVRRAQFDSLEQRVTQLELK